MYQCALLYATRTGESRRRSSLLLLEPAFDIYVAQVKMAGGIPVYCPLRPQKLITTTDTMAGASQHFTLDLDTSQ
jgi:aspartate/methionine/tyrosine aminotransferase